MSEELGINKKLKEIEEKVLKSETNQFLEELKNLMEKRGVAKTLVKNRKPGRTQFKKLMDATEEASSVEELLLFISYQKSKSKKEGWEKKCINEKDIAENLVESFINVQNNIYSKIVEKAYERKIEINNEEERILKINIAKKYMGYLYWKASVVNNGK